MHNRSTLLAVVLASLVAGSIAAQADKPARTEEPPLLDRNLFFDDPQIAGAQISPDGQWISFRRPYQDVMNIWVKGVSEPFDKARPITAAISNSRRPETLAASDTASLYFAPSR